MLRYLTAGESHGECLCAVLEGMPAGVPIDCALMDKELSRRQGGYGRGGRMKIERDRVKIVSGVRGGRTLGSPIALLIANKDYPNWEERMSVSPFSAPVEPLTQPRPGHADLTGGIKYASHDMRDILERSSARETAIRTAVGAVAKQLLAQFAIEIISHVTDIGGVKAPAAQMPYNELFEAAEASPVRCFDAETSRAMMRRIDEAKETGDSLGGVFEVLAVNVPPGLGSHVHWDRRLNGNLARAMMSIQAIKGVEIGDGFALADLPGSAAHDEIFYSRERGFYRAGNHAGGVEGGMSNGETIVLRAVMKPIPTLMRPLASVDTLSKKAVKAGRERSDTCAVPAAAVIGEGVTALELVRSLQEKIGGDSLGEMKSNFSRYLERVSAY